MLLPVTGKKARSQIGWHQSASIREVGISQKTVNECCDDSVISVGTEDKVSSSRDPKQLRTNENALNFINVFWCLKFVFKNLIMLCNRYVHLF